MDYFADFKDVDIFDKYTDFNHLEGMVSLIRFVQFQEESAIYSVGAIGEQFLDFLQYSDNLKYFYCVVTKETNGNNTEQKFSHFLPVMPLEMLLHMKETTLIIVCAPLDRHNEIRQELVEHGFKKIIFLAEKIHDLIKKNLQRFDNSGQSINWFVSHVTEELKEMDCFISEQQNIAELHTKTFSKYRNCFYGKKIVLLANGATTKYYEPLPDAIHINLGITRLRNDIKPEYYFSIENDQSDNESDLEHCLEKIDGEIFFGQCLAGYNTITTNLVPSENFYLEHDNISKFYFSPTMRYPGTIPLNVDICSHVLTGLIDVTTFALRFALFTYPKEIYLVGFDSIKESYITSDDEGTLGLPMLPQIKILFARIKMFARCHYPNTEIISVNPIGLKNLFKDIYTDDYQKFYQ